MPYRITFTADDSTRPLVWDRQTRKTTAHIVKDVIDQAGEIIITVCDAPRHFATYDPWGDCWDIGKHASGRSLYYGYSYKTLSGALNKLDRLAETEVRV